MESYLSGFVAGVVLAIITLMIASASWEDSRRQAIIKHGCGYYDSQTGDFKLGNNQ